MTGMFPVMLFGLPAACLAMYRNALPERRKVMGGIFLSMALTSFLTGVTEPLNLRSCSSHRFFYLIHAVLTGLSMAVTNMLNIHLGFTFSGGFIDMVWVGASPPRLAGIPGRPGLCADLLQRVQLLHPSFQLKTPGEDTQVVQAEAMSDNQRATAYIQALGGAQNLLSVGACTTRLRLDMVDRNKRWMRS
ncbi:phosphotransferase system, EIIC domain-containing protein [Ditylenchus destructor]|nr:phosphotransferase system, EIIC domain-containing protein [Ditylenchus destructor]